MSLYEKIRKEVKNKADQISAGLEEGIKNMGSEFKNIVEKGEFFSEESAIMTKKGPKGYVNNMKESADTYGEVNRDNMLVFKYLAEECSNADKAKVELNIKKDYKNLEKLTQAGESRLNQGKTRARLINYGAKLRFAYGKGEDINEFIDEDLGDLKKQVLTERMSSEEQKKLEKMGLTNYIENIFEKPRTYGKLSSGREKILSKMMFHAEEGVAPFAFVKTNVSELGMLLRYKNRTKKVPEELKTKFEEVDTEMDAYSI